MKKGTKINKVTKRAVLVDGEILEVRGRKCRTEDLKLKTNKYWFLMDSIHCLLLLPCISVWIGGSHGHSIGSFPSFSFCKQIYNDVFETKITAKTYSKVKAELIKRGFVEAYEEGERHEPTRLLTEDYVPETLDEVPVYTTPSGTKRRNYSLYRFKFLEAS